MKSLFAFAESMGEGTVILPVKNIYKKMFKTISNCRLGNGEKWQSRSHVRYGNAVQGTAWYLANTYHALEFVDVVSPDSGSFHRHLRRGANAETAETAKPAEPATNGQDMHVIDVGDLSKNSVQGQTAYHTETDDSSDESEEETEDDGLGGGKKRPAEKETAEEKAAKVPVKKEKTDNPFSKQKTAFADFVDRRKFAKPSWRKRRTFFLFA